MNNLIKWIGFEDCEVKSVLHNNKGNNGYEQDNQTSTLFRGSCRYIKS